MHDGKIFFDDISENLVNKNLQGGWCNFFFTQNMTVKQREKFEEAKRLKEEEEEREARRLAAQVNVMRPRTAAELRNR